jgi:hypothetical protein
MANLTRYLLVFAAGQAAQVLAEKHRKDALAKVRDGIASGAAAVVRALSDE